MRKRLVVMGLILALALALPLGWCLADEEGVSEDETREIALEINQLGDADSGEDEAIDEEDVDEDINLFPEEKEFAWADLFPDVSADADYAEAVAVLANMGIFTGYNDGDFHPDATITRAEIATITCRLMGVADKAQLARNQMYTDVSGHWAEGYITTATELGVFNGDGSGRFRPLDNVTYEQVVKILVCVCGYESQAQQNGGWPNGYMAVAKTLGFTSGMYFTQTADAPRSAVAQLIYNIIR